jgi:hypothetical protein
MIPDAEKIQITQIGERAARCLDGTDQPGWISGITSKGIFVTLKTGFVLFVTDYADHGPMTLNIAHREDYQDLVEINDAIHAGGFHLASDVSGVTFIMSPQTIKWSAPPPAGNRIPLGMRQEIIRALIADLVREKEGQGFSFYLDPLARYAGEKDDPAGEDEILRALLRMSQALQRHQPDKAVNWANSIVGYGRGLTPSGDDFLIGVFLSMARWGLPPGWSPTEWKMCIERILTSARQKTTLISINLLQCAADGEADERLIHAADLIFCGKTDRPETINGLLRWGNSSGVDSAAGMIAVSQAIRDGTFQR